MQHQRIAESRESFACWQRRHNLSRPCQNSGRAPRCPFGHRPGAPVGTRREVADPLNLWEEAPGVPPPRRPASGVPENLPPAVETELPAAGSPATAGRQGRSVLEVPHRHPGPHRQGRRAGQHLCRQGGLRNRRPLVGARRLVEAELRGRQPRRAPDRRHRQRRRQHRVLEGHGRVRHPVLRRQAPDARLARQGHHRHYRRRPGHQLRLDRPGLRRRLGGAPLQVHRRRRIFWCRTHRRRWASSKRTRKGA